MRMHGANRAMTDSRLVLEIAAVTHQGCVRTRNDDTIAVNTWRSSDPMVAPLSTRQLLDRPHVMVVCDGMGGQPGGRIASLTAIEALIGSLPLCLEDREIADRITQASVLLNELARQDASLQWMGTTVAGILVTPDTCFWFNVGDSSVFRLKGYLVKLSHDDTHGGKRTGVILQALGGTPLVADITPHVGRVSIADGVSFLICSDGLTDAVSIDQIEDEMHGTAHDIVDRLLNLALIAGARDNVSIIMIHVCSEGGDLADG